MWSLGCDRRHQMRKKQRRNEEFMNIRTMTIEDYEGVYALWMSIKGFAIRSLDDSYEGVSRF